MKNILLFTIVIIFNYFIGVFTENSYYIVSVIKEGSKDNQQLIDYSLNDCMNDFYNIIEENQDTYISENGEKDEMLKELETVPKRKRNENGIERKLLFKNDRISASHMKRSLELLNSTNSTIEYIPFESVLVDYICPIKNYNTVAVYLSDEAAKEVCHMPNVLYCEKSFSFEPQKAEKQYSSVTNDKVNSKNIKQYSSVTNDKIDNKNIKQNYDTILKETNWTSVSVQPSPNGGDFFLSLISQSNDIDDDKPRDNNFYYPSTAGQGIDIYFIDDGLIAHPDYFDTYEGTEYERTVSCDAIASQKEIRETTDTEKKSCVRNELTYPNHGISVSSTAAGNVYGVAKKANIHMIAMDYTIIGSLRSIDYVLRNAKPHKTILSMSFEVPGYIQSYDDKLTDLINAGIIVFVSAGNGGVNVCGEKDDENFGSFAGCRKAIAVGATDSSINNKKYQAISFSSFGDCIDIFAPGNVLNPNLEYDEPQEDSSVGTSFSTPLVAGVAASIMSEHPEIKFDNDLMRKTLIEMSIKDAIVKSEDGIEDPFDKINNTPNRFINNGKRSIYVPKCGGPSGTKCSDGCCSKEGECISFKNGYEQCFIENGCQSEFGHCFTMENIIEECEKELKEYEECQVNISFTTDSDLFDENKLNSCKIFNSEKCQTFYKNLNQNQSICSFAKKFKSLKFIDHFDSEKFNEYFDSCEQAFEYHTNECNNDINKYEDCIIDGDYIKFLDIKELRKICITFKSELCTDVNSKLEEILRNNQSCKLIEKYDYSDYSDLYTTENTSDNYDKVNDICIETLENLIPINECEKELEEYKRCLDFSFNNNNSNYNDFAKQCIINNNRCQNFFREGLSYTILTCHYLKQSEITDLSEKLEEKRMEYLNHCVENVPEEFKEKVISSCKDDIEKNDCFLKKSGITEDIFNKTCKAIQTSKCEKYKSIIETIPECSLAFLYDSSIEHIDDDINSQYKTNIYYCEEEGPKDYIKGSCYYSLDEKYSKYSPCIFDEEATNEDDFYYQCLFFTSNECQEFYHQSLENYPDCLYLQKKNWIFIPTTTHPKWQFYHDNCQNLVDSKRVTKSIESTTTTTTTQSSKPTITKSNEQTTLSTVKPTTTKKVKTTKIKVVKTTKTKVVKTSKKVTVTKKVVTTKKVKTTKKVIKKTKKSKKN